MTDRRIRVPDREMREALVEFDDGDPDAEVFRVYTRKSASAYHVDYSCPHAMKMDSDNVVEDTRRGAQLRWYYPCRVCAIDWEEAESYLNDRGIPTRCERGAKR